MQIKTRAFVRSAGTEMVASSSGNAMIRDSRMGWILLDDHAIPHRSGDKQLLGSTKNEIMKGASYGNLDNEWMGLKRNRLWRPSKNLNRNCVHVKRFSQIRINGILKLTAGIGNCRIFDCSGLEKYKRKSKSSSSFHVSFWISITVLTNERVSTTVSAENIRQWQLFSP